MKQAMVECDRSRCAFEHQLRDVALGRLRHVMSEHGWPYQLAPIAKATLATRSGDELQQALQRQKLQ